MQEGIFRRGRPQNRRRWPAAVLKTPLIPLQEQVQPLIPLQVSSPRAKLQHELSHAKPTLPNQTGAAPPQATKMAARFLHKRQQIVTSTVTDAGVVVINGSGQTIAVTTITGVPTGPIPITLPFTTITVEPLESITGVLTMTPVASSIDPLPILTSNLLSASSTQSPSSQATSVSLPLTTISTLAEPSPSGNNQLGQPNTPASTTSISISTSLTGSPSTLATIASSALITDSSSSSSTTSSSIFTSSTSATITPSITGASSATSGIPAATTAAAAASTGGSTVNVPVVAGVVGGLGGLAVVLGLLLLLLRWLHGRQSESQMLRSMDEDRTAPGTAHSNAPMTQNFTSAGPAGAAAAGAAGGVGIGAMIKRMTGGSTATTDTAPSERGFQNLGGRKLESVLVSGGDGFGEPAASGDQLTSFSRGWAERFPYETPSRHSSMIVGPATPFRRPSSSVVELSASRPDSETIRAINSPPRNAAAGPGWPLSNTSAGRPVRGPEMSESSSPPQPFRGVPSLDPLGRTRYSQDGSRNSRFTEGL